MPEISSLNGRPSPIDLVEHETRLALLQRAAAGDRTAAQALADRYHVRIGGMVPRATPGGTVKRGGTMSDDGNVTCEECGQQVKRRGLGVHKAKAHGIRVSTKAHAPETAPMRGKPSNGAGSQNGCSACLFRGLERVVDQELVRSAIVAGMSYGRGLCVRPAGEGGAGHMKYCAVLLTRTNRGPPGEAGVAWRCLGGIPGERVMPTQRSVAVQFWNSRAVKSFSPYGKLLALNFMTGSHSNYVGVFRLSFDDCTDETGLSREDIVELLPTLQAVQPYDGESFAHYDPETRVTWVTKRLEYEFPNGKLSETQRQSIRKIIEVLPVCKVLISLCERYSTRFNLGEPFVTLAGTLSNRVSNGPSDTLSDGVSDTHRIPLSALCSPLPALCSPLSVVGGEPHTPPSNGGRPDVSDDLRAWLLATIHLKPLADAKYAELWKALESAYDEYAWLYFETEIRKADAWICANPTRKPTQRGLGTFMRNWLDRAVEMGRRHDAKAQAAR